MTDINEIIIGKLTIIQDKISDLCERVTRIETEYKAHIEKKDRAQATRRERVYLAAAVIASITAIYSILGLA